MPPIPERGGGVSRDALLVIHIPLLHFSFYLQIPQRNDTSPFGKVRSPLRELRWPFICLLARFTLLSLRNP